ncbi:MAG TPA: hypothetical protein VGG83_02765 [Trebonia sp.]|jgi:hypothetical protein
MATAINFMDTCALAAPASRRFYVHVTSLGFLIAAQPSIFEEVASALALSGASRALDQAVEDWEMFSPSGGDPSLAQGADNLHKLAAEALRTSFQCIVHLVPQEFGATELLLAATEEINAWCYEDGYLTYATDENAAAIMYAETGSLRELRSQIRRSPGSDPALQMFSGHSLFLYDQKAETGSGTALFYRRQAARLLRNSPETRFPTGLVDARVADDLATCVSPSALTYDGTSVADACQRRASLMVTTLLRAMP